MVDRDTAPAAPPNHDRLGSTHRFMDSDQSLLKVTQSLGHSLPGGYIVVRIDDEGERVLYVRKGGDREESTDPGIDQRRPDEIAGYMHCSQRSKRNIRGSGESPKDRKKGKQRYDR